jgi:O-antigen/teichoic acid export membrane protein
VVSTPAPEVDGRRGSRDVLLQVGFRVLNLALGLVVTVLIVRTLGQAGYGRWTTLMAIYAILGYFSSLGMETVAVREAAARPEETGAWVGALLVTRLALTLPVMLAGAVVIAVVHESREMLVAGVILLAQFPVGIGGSLRIVHQLRVRNTLPMIVLTVNSVAWGAAVVVIHALDGGLVALAVALLLTTALASTLQLVAALRIVGLRLRPSRAAVRRLARAGTTVGVASMLMVAYASIDQIIVFRQAGDVAAGYYGAATRLLVTAHFIPASLMTTIAPLVAAAWPGDRERLLRLVRTATEVLAMVSLGGLAFSLVGADPVVRLVFGADFGPAADAVPVLAGAFVLICMTYLTGNLLLVLGRTRIQAVAAFVALAINVTGNLILVPRHGFIAAAWMTLVTELIVAAFGLVVVTRELGLSRPPVGRAARALVAAGLLAAGLKGLDAAGAPLGVLLAATAVAYPALLLGLRALAPAELRVAFGRG